MSMTEPTIEDCLKELREIFGAHYYTRPEYSGTSVRWHVMAGCPARWFSGASLDQMMAQVRTWKESHKDVTK